MIVEPVTEEKKELTPCMIDAMRPPVVEVPVTVVLENVGVSVNS